MSNKIVKCRGCGNNILELITKPLHNNTEVRFKDFIGINNHPTPVIDTDTRCNICGSDIFNEIVEVYRANIW